MGFLWAAEKCHSPQLSPSAIFPLGLHVHFLPVESLLAFFICLVCLVQATAFSDKLSIFFRAGLGANKYVSLSSVFHCLAQAPVGCETLVQMPTAHGTILHAMKC